MSSAYTSHIRIRRRVSDPDDPRNVGTRMTYVDNIRCVKSAIDHVRTVPELATATLDRGDDGAAHSACVIIANGPDGDGRARVTRDRIRARGPVVLCRLRSKLHFRVVIITMGAGAYAGIRRNRTGSGGGGSGGKNSENDRKDRARINTDPPYRVTYSQVQHRRRRPSARRNPSRCIVNPNTT